MKKVRRIGIWAVVSFLTALVIGCGSGGGATVSGTVTLDGEPITKGSIFFDPIEASGGKVTGLIEDGKYFLKPEAGLARGKYRVEIRWPKPTGKMIPVVDDPPNKTEELKEAVPRKYNEKSELTVEIGSGATTKDFPLTKK